MSRVANHITPDAALSALLGPLADLIAERVIEVITPRMMMEVQPETNQDYIEPGPSSIRKWFERDELYTRWGVGKSKLQELEALGSLPAWRPGPQKVLYFWAHVWACEGRMTSQEADRIFGKYAPTDDVDDHRHPLRSASIRRLSVDR